MEDSPVVTVFLRNRGEVLLLRRSEAVGSYVGRWGAVAGYAEGDPDAAARQEIREETGFEAGYSFVRSGEAFAVEDRDLGTRWIVHPYLVDCETRAIEPNRETAAAEWTSPTEILRRDTVPELWTSYDRVRPTVRTVATDTEHGSAYISVRALEVLRDRAGEVAAERANGWSDLADLARDLLDARRSMTAVRNRVDRVMHRAGAEGTPRAVEEAARAEIERAVSADAEAAGTAAERIQGDRVLTLSRSGTVLDTLVEGDPREVIVAESRPAREGVVVAEELADAGVDVTLCLDAAVGHVLATSDVDTVLVGADTVLPDGSVVNKVGTRLLGLAASHEDVPAYAVASRDKISPDPEPHLESGDPGEVYRGGADVEPVNPTFDATPADLLAGVITEDEVLTAGEVAAVADERRRLSDWSQDPNSADG